MTNPNLWTGFTKTMSCTDSFLQKCISLQKIVESTTAVISKLVEKTNLSRKLSVAQRNPPFSFYHPTIL